MNIDELNLNLTEPPTELKKKYQRDYWQRVCIAVAVIAKTGYSAAPDLLDQLANLFYVTLQSNSINRLIYQTLPQDGLADKFILPLGPWAKLAVITLTDYGKDVARALGNEPVESDYERILRLHDGENQPAHTAQVLFTAYQARIRKMKVVVMPFEENDRTPWFRPDLSISDELHYYPVEVETHSRNNPKKWEYKREANVVLPTPSVRHAVVNRLKKMHVPGRATDLITLARYAKDYDLSYFWLERW
jgi:hypothetical protein